MSDGPEWFAAKRYGFGAGPPISWQGWAVTLGFVAAMIGVRVKFATKPLVMIAIMVPLVTAFLVICAKTTRGGWRWRWREKDQ
jgi:hypothetical protein